MRSYFVFGLNIDALFSPVFFVPAVEAVVAFPKTEVTLLIIAGCTTFAASSKF